LIGLENFRGSRRFCFKEGCMKKKESFEPLDILDRQRIRIQMIGYVMCGGLIFAGMLS